MKVDLSATEEFLETLLGDCALAAFKQVVVCAFSYKER